MRSKTLVTGIATVALGGAMAFAPSASCAQGWYHPDRSSQKTQWAAFAIGGALLGIAGALNHDKTAAALGTAAAIYSGYRYSADGSGCESRERVFRFERGRVFHFGHRG